MTATAAPPLTYEVRAEIRAGGEASARSRQSRIPFDGAAQQGNALPGPADLLCAALSACILKNVERFSHVLPFRYESAAIHIVAEREEPPPHIVRMRYDLEVVTDEPTARVELLHRNIQRFGTITNTLAKACEVSGTIRAVAPIADASEGSSR